MLKIFVYEHKCTFLKFFRRGGPCSVMVTLLTHMQEVKGSNPAAPPPSLEPTSPIPRLQVTKMCQGSLKGMLYAKAEHTG